MFSVTIQEVELLVERLDIANSLGEPLRHSNSMDERDLHVHADHHAHVRADGDTAARKRLEADELGAFLEVGIRMSLRRRSTGGTNQ